MELVAEGKTNQEIAERLWISVETAKEHVHNLCRLLGVNRRSACVAEAVRRGWIPAGQREKRYS